jgi:hypothetical protein
VSIGQVSISQVSSRSATSVTTTCGEDDTSLSTWEAIVKLHFSRNACVCAFAVAAAVASTGCAARIATGETVATVDADDTVYVDAAPVSIESYPHYRYAGADVYYANGHYYRRSGNRWAYYRHAPRELERQRTYVQRAPAERRDVPYNAAPAPGPR